MPNPFPESKEVLQERARQFRSILEPIKLDDSVFIVAPKDFEVHDVTSDIDKDVTIQNTLNFHDADSLCSYVNKYMEDDTTCFVNAEKKLVKVIIDYHNPSSERTNCQHIAFFQPKVSKDWKTWIANNGSRLGQYDFALFLEEQADSITEPSGAEMLELATKFKVIRKARFSKGVNINTGEVQFSFHNENEKGSITMPSEFKIVIPVFEYGDNYELKARLRYRLNDDHLRLWYELIRPDKAEDLAIKSVKESVTKGLNENILVVMGE